MATPVTNLVSSVTGALGGATAGTSPIATITSLLTTVTRTLGASPLAVTITHAVGSAANAGTAIAPLLAALAMGQPTVQFHSPSATPSSAAISPGSLFEFVKLPGPRCAQVPAGRS
ncbi:hypothetical protein [Cupriavidus sp. D39]|uniref:hypothetical protein n=1 Tax=Cupriavidus sp. D39 TaxID=2997877 RepID=UPI00226EF222|nr:hypothetical protein [Cupriavidus sp. D39]MCY0854021.1 hypothetical protein [Cupriavidus sp. D39]